MVGVQEERLVSYNRDCPISETVEYQAKFDTLRIGKSEQSIIRILTYRWDCFNGVGTEEKTKWKWTCAWLCLSFDIACSGRSQFSFENLVGTAAGTNKITTAMMR